MTLASQPIDGATSATPCLRIDLSESQWRWPAHPLLWYHSVSPPSKHRLHSLTAVCI